MQILDKMDKRRKDHKESKFKLFPYPYETSGLCRGHFILANFSGNIAYMPVFKSGCPVKSTLGALQRYQMFGGL